MTTSWPRFSLWVRSRAAWDLVDDPPFPVWKAWMVQGGSGITIEIDDGEKWMWEDVDQ